MFNPKLFHQGLILLSIPVAFQIAASCTLYNMLMGAQRQIATQEFNKLVTQSIRDISRGISKIPVVLYGYFMTEGSAVSARRLEAEEQSISENLAELCRLIEHKPALQESKRRIEILGREMLERLDELKQYLDDHSVEALSRSPTIGRQIQNEIDPLLTAFDLETSKIQKQIHPRDLPSRDSRQGMVSLLQWGLLLGVSTNVAVALCLLVYFNRSTIKRLAVLSDNAARIVSGEPLNQSFGGTDEIATLDRTFHQMADSLKLAENLRREYVSMVTHDLRTPLTSIGMSLELLEMAKVEEMPEADRELIENAQRNVARLRRLVDDLLQIERLESGSVTLNYTRHKLKDIVLNACDSVAQFARQSGIAIAADIPELEFETDSDRLIQVLVNLLSNAVKFSPSGTTVTVTAQIRADSVDLSVADEGRGIPAAQLKSVFERFKQVERDDERRKGGSGLGLPICRAIIKQMGGKIDVASEPGKGSRFYFELPLAAPQPIN